jgi:hypothetical protein
MGLAEAAAASDGCERKHCRTQRQYVAAAVAAAAVKSCIAVVVSVAC